MAALYQVVSPEPFPFSHLEEWTRWSCCLEHFRQVSDLKENDNEAQVNTLICSMRHNADDILQSFGLSEIDFKKYNVVIAKFESHFIKRSNVIFELGLGQTRRRVVHQHLHYSTLSPNINLGRSSFFAGQGQDLDSFTPYHSLTAVYQHLLSMVQRFRT